MTGYWQTDGKNARVVLRNWRSRHSFSRHTGSHLLSLTSISRKTSNVFDWFWENYFTFQTKLDFQFVMSDGNSSRLTVVMAPADQFKLVWYNCHRQEEEKSCQITASHLRGRVPTVFALHAETLQMRSLKSERNMKEPVWMRVMTHFWSNLVRSQEELR